MQRQSHGRHRGAAAGNRRTAATWAGAALQPTRRITYRFTGSPATRITGERMMSSGRMARETGLPPLRPGTMLPGVRQPSGGKHGPAKDH